MFLLIIIYFARYIYLFIHIIFTFLIIGGRMFEFPYHNFYKSFSELTEYLRRVN